MPEISIYKSNPIVQIIAGANTGMSGVTSASNLGAGAGVFSSKVGNDLQFKSLVAGANISLSSDSTTITINGASAAPFTDATPLIKNSIDATKLAIFSVANISTGTTRTYTLPDANGEVLITTGPTQTILSQKDWTNGTFSLLNPASTFRYFIATSAIVANRSITLPLLTSSDVFVTEAFAQSLTNKKLGSLTTNGFVKTSGGDGTLSVDTSTYIVSGSAWLLASGGALTGVNTIIGTSSNILTYQFNGLTSTQVNGAGALFQNTSAAAPVVQQNSPSVSWEGRGWATVPVASQSVAWTSYVVPISDTTNPTSTWKLATSINGAGYSDVITVSPWGPSSGLTGTVLLIAGAGTDHRISFNTPSSNHLIRSDSAAGKLTVQAQVGYIALNIGGVDKIRVHDGSASGVKNGDISIGSTTDAARLYVVQDPLSSSWNPALKLIPGANTNQNSGASSEFPDFVFGGLSTDANTAVSTRTSTWSAGTVAIQRSMYIKGTVLTGASATANFTNAYTVFIDPPVQGASASISNLWALGLAGSALITQTTGAPALRLVNTSNGGSSAVLNAQTVFGAIMNYGGSGLVLTGGSGTAIGNVPILNLVGGVLSAQTASTELTDAVFDFSRTVTWATGAIATQRSMWIKGMTMAFAGASVVTSAYSLYVSGITAGANATITNNRSFGAGDIAGSNGFYVAADGFTMGPISHNNTSFGTSAIMPSIIYTMRLAVDQNISGITTGVAFQVNPLAYTGSAASTERFDNYFNGARTVQFATGALTTQRFSYFSGATISFVGASTLANAYTVYIDPPVAGTNATITNNWALGINGNFLSTRGLIGATAFATGASFEVSGSTISSTFLWGTLATPQGGLTFSGTECFIDAKTGGMNFRSNGSTQAAAITALQNFNIGVTAATTNVSKLYVQQAALTTTGAIPTLRLDPGAHTNMTLSTEFPNVVVNTVTQQWATGNLAIQRNIWIKAPTWAFVGASILTDACNLYVDSPVAGTNATITNNYALGINGKTKIVTVPTNDNAATDLLVRDSTTGEVKYRTVASISSAAILTADVTLNQAQILTLNSSPVQLVVAPGAGKFIQIIGPVICKYVFNSAAFATNVNLRIKHGTGVTSNVLSNVIDQTANAYGNFGSVQWTGLATAVENQAVNIDVATGNPTAGGASSTLRVTFQYIIATL